MTAWNMPGNDELPSLTDHIKAADPTSLVITGLQGPGRGDNPPPASVDHGPGGTAEPKLIALPTGNRQRTIVLEPTRLGYRIPDLPGVDLELVEDDPPYYEAWGPVIDALNLPRGLRVDRKAGRLAADIIRRSKDLGQ